MDQRQARLGSGSRPRVVIVGAGFGGLYAAKALACAPVDVTVLDRTNHHLFQPMLYQVATGQLSADEIAAPIRSVLAEQKNTEVLLEEVSGVDLAARTLQTSEGERGYDFLIVATGAEYNYFGHDDWRRFAPSLKSLDDAARIRERLLDAFERAERENDPAEARRLMTFVLIGGGPTGVEMAGAIAELAHKTLRGDFRRIDPSTTRIVLVEAMPRLLGGFDEDLADHARRKLEEMRVEVRLNTPVEAVESGGVKVKGEEIRAANVIWTAGVMASPAARWLGAQADKTGRVLVQPDLSLDGHPEVFVIGDTAHVAAPRVNLFGQPISTAEGEPPSPLPGIAQPAMQEGQYAAAVIRRRVRNLAPPPPFRYKDKGNLATIGRSYAIADLGRVRLWGFVAWIIWIGVHIWYLIGFANRLLVMVEWAVAYLTYQRTGRIITTKDALSNPLPGRAPRQDRAQTPA